MTSVGIVGGLGPESTIDYYRRILEAWAREDPSTAPSIVIDSLDVQRALHLVERDRPALVEYLLASVRRLAGAGVDFVAMTANTPHIVFDEMAARSPVPLLSIVEVCAQEAQRRGLGRLALLGTRFTMEGPFYPAVCARYGIAVVTPRDVERAWVHERYVGQLLRGEFRDDTRREFISLVGRLRAEEGVDGVILGGTELPLLLASEVIADVPVLDTTALHVVAIVNRLRQAEPSQTSPAGVALCGAATVFEATAINGVKDKATLTLRPTALDHVGLKVTDMDTTLDFYQRLGLTLLRTSGPGADGVRSAVLRVGNQELNVFSRLEVASSGTEHPVGMDHFCLSVDAASIDDVIGDLRRVGIDIVRGPVKRRDGTALFVHDPDGVRVELQLKKQADGVPHGP